MLIQEKPLQHWIDHFYGYGSWQARIWFVGHEETGGDLPEEVAEKINHFYEEYTEGNSVLCDIRELYRQVTISSEDPKAALFVNHWEYRFGKNAIQNGVWKNLIAFEYGYKNEQLPDLIEYQKYVFASPSESNEALIRLYPLPASHTHAWYYSWLDLPQLFFLKSRTAYEQHLYQRRIHTILSNIRQYKPDVVLMYGMDNINALKKSMRDFFHGEKFKLIKATKQLIPQHHRADIEGTTILITTQMPALRHNRIETGFDWEEFGKLVKSQN